MSRTAPGTEDSSPANSQWVHRLEQARFTRLLVALSVLLFGAPFIGMFGSQLGSVLATLLVIAVLTTVLVAAALSVSESQRQSRVTLVLAAACIMLTWLGNLADSSAVRIAQAVLTIGFLMHVVRLIVRALFRRDRADYDTIAASICGYLLIGVAFAAVYSLTMELDARAFNIGEASRAVPDVLHFGDHHTATSLYFSFVTLTTLGYGDITPISMPARMLTTAEALIGQLYLVVLVARLVGLHISQATTHSDEEA